MWSAQMSDIVNIPFSIYIILNSPCPIYQHLSINCNKAFWQTSIFGLVFFVSGFFGEVPDKEILENVQLWAECSEPCYFFDISNMGY